jgi:hypothetical protein
LSEVSYVEELPGASRRPDPELEGDLIREPLIIGNVHGVRAAPKNDFAGANSSGVRPIQVDHALVIDLEDRAIIRNHLELVIARFSNPEDAVVVDAEPRGARGDAGNTGGAREELVGYIKGGSVEGSNRV